MAQYYGHKPSFRRQNRGSFDVYHDRGGGNIIRRTIDLTPRDYSGGRAGKLPSRETWGPSSFASQKWTAPLNRGQPFGKAAGARFQPKTGTYGWTVRKWPSFWRGVARHPGAIMDAGSALYEYLNGLGVDLPGWAGDIFGIPGSSTETPAEWEDFDGWRYQKIPGYDRVQSNWAAIWNTVNRPDEWKWGYSPALGTLGHLWELGRIVVENPHLDPNNPDDGAEITQNRATEYQPAVYGVPDMSLQIVRMGANGPDGNYSWAVRYAPNGQDISDLVGKPVGSVWVGPQTETPPPVITEGNPIGLPFPIGPYPYPWPVWIVARPQHALDERSNGDSRPKPVANPLPNTPGGIVTIPPTRPAPPTYGERERKFRFNPDLYAAYEAARWALQSLTEVQDLVDALWDALPSDVKASGLKAKGLPEKFMDLFNNLDRVDWDQAIRNVVANEIEDQLVGRGLGKLNDAAKRLGLPSGTRFNNVLFGTLGMGS